MEPTQITWDDLKIEAGEASFRERYVNVFRKYEGQIIEGEQCTAASFARNMGVAKATFADWLKEDQHSTDTVPSRSLTVSSTQAYMQVIALFERTLLQVAKRCESELPGLADALSQVVITYGRNRTKSEAYGHFECGSWKHDENVVHELFVNAEPPANGPYALLSRAEQVISTLAHEAIHVYAEANGVDDVSRSGWHNEQFGALAEKIKLKVERLPGVGYTTLGGLSDEGLLEYGDLIEKLHNNLALNRIVREPIPRIPRIPSGQQSGMQAEKEYVDDFESDEDETCSHEHLVCANCGAAVTKNEVHK